MRLLSVRSTLSTVSLFVAAVMGLGVTTSCGVEVAGSEQGDALVSYVDEDGDGTSDGVDTDGDGEADFSIAGCTQCEPTTRLVCRVPLIDENRDGVPDGLDTNCDGRIDLRFDVTGGGGGGQSNRCVASSTVNGTKLGVSCQGSGGTSTCECRRNDQVVQTCTQASSTCALSVSNGRVSAGCCQF